MKNFFSIALVISSFVAASQDIPDSLKLWKKGGTGNLNFSQTALSNWAQGGENAISATAVFNLFANYQKNKSGWDNSFDAAFGFLQTDNNPLRKSDDKFELSSKYGYKTSKKWSIAGQINFKSQFTEGYKYPNDTVMISNFLAPGYLMVSTGMDYKPNENFSFLLSPVTGKVTIVNDKKLADAGAFGVDKALFDSAGVQQSAGKKIRYEFGTLISIKAKQDIAKNISLTTKLDLFSNYFNNPENIDVNWDLLISMKVNKYVSASINTTLIYDHDIPVPIYQDVAGVKTEIGTGPRTQFKEVLAIGFSFKF